MCRPLHWRPSTRDSRRSAIALSRSFSSFSASRRSTTTTNGTRPSFSSPSFSALCTEQLVWTHPPYPLISIFPLIISLISKCLFQVSSYCRKSPTISDFTNWITLKSWSCLTADYVTPSPSLWFSSSIPPASLVSRFSSRRQSPSSSLPFSSRWVNHKAN